MKKRKSSIKELKQNKIDYKKIPNILIDKIDKTK